MSALRFVRFGDAALRASLPEGVDRAAVRERLAREEGVVDVVVTERHVAVVFAAQAPASLDVDLGPARLAPEGETRGALRVVPVRYDGPDLDGVAEACGLLRDEVVARHAGATYDVLFLGFAPGFAYLGPVDAGLVVPRLPAPRARIPAGAVAIAGGYTGIYPFATPGGWRLLGTAVGFAPFSATSGARLRQGDRVRFEVVT